MISRTAALLALLLLAMAASAQKPVATLPQVYLDTTYALPTGGQTWAAHTAVQLTAALNGSAPGDVIVLDAGVTYTGNFTLPAKANPNGKWIYIVGSNYAALPAPGTRVSPADAANMPKLATSNVVSALTFASGSNYWRLVGLEVLTASAQGCNPSATPPQNCYSYSLIATATYAQGVTLPSNITIDRCYIHGQPTLDLQRAISAAGDHWALIDSDVREVHGYQVDTQAFAAWWGNGPFKIANNYLEATTENVMFGGAGGVANPFVPADIEIRGNYFFKPLRWAVAGVTLPPGNPWVVKNLLEFKSAQRVLVTGNTFENVWVSGQSGFALMLTPRPNQDGSGAPIDDITVTGNVFKNVSSGFDILAHDDNCLPANGCADPGEARRNLLVNNLFLLGDTTQPGYGNGYAWCGLIMPHVADFVFQHNTCVPPPNLGACRSSLYFEMYQTGAATPPASRTTNVWVLDNVLCRYPNGEFGWIFQYPAYTLQDYMGDPPPPEPRMLGNVFYAPPGDTAYAVPAQNLVTSTAPAFDATWKLTTPVWNQTSDGQLAGFGGSAPDYTPTLLRALVN